MKKKVFQRGLSLSALISAVLVLFLAGCPEEPEKEKINNDPVISSVKLELARDSGAAIAGAGGEYKLLITVVGKNIFPINLANDPNVIFSIFDFNTPKEMIGAVIAGTVTASGVETPFKITVDNIFADEVKNVDIVVSVHGKYSGRVTLEVKPTDLTGSVTLNFNPASQTLTANTSALPGDGTDTFQWQRSASANGSFSDITGANDSSYVLKEEDFDNYIRVNVKRTGFSNVWLSSEVYGLADDAPVITSGIITLTVSGTAALGGTVTANVSGIPSGVSPVYSWLRGTGEDFEFIKGANGDNYAISANDSGFAIRASIRIAGYRGRLYSAPTALIPKTVTNYIDDLYTMYAKGELPSTYTIQMNYQNETIEPQDLYFNDLEIEITVKGMPSVLTLDVTNYGAGAMFSVVEGVTLVLEDVTLIGIEENYFPLIDIILGSLIINDGTEIKDNANYNATGFDYMGGGINNYYGTVIMEGGSITDNLSFHGGGVMNFGDFIFRNGKISGNTASTDDYGEGGGVFNFEDALFIMEGGEISGNFARFGGGVVNDDTFIMTGGAISSNVSTDWEFSTSGGVDNLYQFVLQDGIIHGTDAPSNLQNIGNYSSLYNKSILATGVYSGTNYADLSENNFTINYRLYLSTDYTLEVVNGNLKKPVAATGITITGIDPKFHGMTVELSYYNFDTYYNLWGWDKYSEPVTISDSTEIPFCFKSGDKYYLTAIPVGANILRLDIIDNNEIVTRYEQEIPLKLGSTTVDIFDFDETCYAVTITDLPANIVGKDWDMDLYYLLEGGSEMRLGTAKRPITTSSVKIVFPWIVGLVLGDEHYVKLAFEEYVNSSYEVRQSHEFSISLDQGNTSISYNNIIAQANGRIMKSANTRLSSLKLANLQGMGFKNKAYLSNPKQKQKQALELIKQSLNFNFPLQKAGAAYVKERLQRDHGKNIGIRQPRDRRLKNDIK